MQSHSEAVFIDLVRTEFDGTTVIKTDNKAKWDAGAFSTAGILNNGYAETVISQTNKTRIFGVSPTNKENKNKIDDLEYAIVLRDWGGGEIRESGSYKASIGNYYIGDKFKIAIEDGILRYYKNTILLYESTAAPIIPQYVDLAFEQKNAEISDVKIVNSTSTKIRAFTDKNPSGITSYNWYKNNVLLSETGSELTLSSFSNGDIIHCMVAPNSGSCSGTSLQSNKMQLYANESIPENDFYIKAAPANQGCYLAEEGLIWLANTPENILINENSVKKTQGYNTSNGGVYSQNAVGDNGFFEFQTGETNTRKMVGLSSQDGGHSESTIQFAFYMESSNLVVYESGSWKGAYGQFSTNDTMRIALENGVVKYYKNSSLLYVSDKVPNLPLIADGTMQDIGTTIINAKMANPTEGMFMAFTSDADNPDLNWAVNEQSTGHTGATLILEDLLENDIITCTYISSQPGCGSSVVASNSIKILPNKKVSPLSFYIEGITQSNSIGVAEEQVVWNPERMANVSNIDNNLIKVQGYNQFNAGASSLNKVKNNGYFDFAVSETNKTKAIGLSVSDPDFNYNSTDYAMVLGNNGMFTIYEKGSWRLGNQPYAVGDILRIVVENSIVKYFRNQTLVYTSNVAPTLPLLVDISLSSEGGTIQNAVVGNENGGEFTSHVSNLGAAPTLQWYVNGIQTGSHQTTLQFPNIENEDIVTCTVTPDFAGCNALAATESNRARFLGPTTLTHWLGSVSTAWSNPANWSEGVPNANLSTRIPADRPHQPLINSEQSAKNVIVETNAELMMAGMVSLLVYGDFIIDGTLICGNGNIAFKGDGNRKLKGDQLVFKELTVNLSSPENEIDLLSEISISKETTFISGKLRTQNHEVIYLKGSKSSKGNSNSFIDGKVRKIGNSSFHFPIGSGNIFAPVEISAPENPTDAFTAQYFNADPTDAGFATNRHDGSLGTISSCEYWTIDRSQGNSMISVSLSYANARSCGIEDPSFLQVLHWNGDEWENKGINYDGFKESDLESGSGIITSQFPINDFSPFTIGTISGTNPLPIELFSFSAEKQNSCTNLEWVTDSESNNSFFTLERSDDAIHFHEILKVAGAGSSRQRQVYKYLDNTPKAGINYYRLSQTDFDGEQTYFDIKSVYFEYNDNIVIYPNPSRGIFTIVRANENPVHMRILDANGKTLWMRDTNEMLTQVSVYQLPQGMYFLSIDDGQNQVTEKIVIK
ncbi:T9SS type A sorting domain-containing protein [Cryomorpha ignava]|uniref:T9SS type A sorting domain-containing protein n=2 Tax=Cryomorpha ignava TaxID=101383 RepID=A0A7K3WSS9_9FLAO|nr:T9SS type A sorting domain-containing protein [Cryomorpha ignava]